MILVDPKRVEMTIYNDIPHLLTPVICEADQTLSALKWAVDEMDRRYKMFAEKGARNIVSYNTAMGYQAIPNIVIFIDELADLMMFAAKEVEDKITRIAQMARAVGIHLVLSTQRPSVNVITGVIKANIPTRIAFNVSSMVDSRVILDTPGAEKLLGRGDMLYIPPDQAKPLRVQGTFVSEPEVKELVGFFKKRLKEQGIRVEYTEEVTQQKVTVKKQSGLMETLDGEDPKFEEARDVVTQYDRASASLLQRRLKIGYARAARILDQLEASGVVGPAEGSKPREVLMQQQSE
jgi:S-DNA-T family DNA segregation ATPase FtsK/SpoIIIE